MGRAAYQRVYPTPDASDPDEIRIIVKVAGSTRFRPSTSRQRIELAANPVSATVASDAAFRGLFKPANDTSEPGLPWRAEDHRNRRA